MYALCNLITKVNEILNDNMHYLDESLKNAKKKKSKTWSFRGTDILGDIIIVVGTQNLTPGHIYFHCHDLGVAFRSVPM